MLAGCQSRPSRARKNPLEHERNYGLGMDALFTVRWWKTNVILVWAWMHWLPYALGTRTESWFGHGCLTNRTHFRTRTELGMDALLITLPRTRTLLWFAHACTGYGMLLEHQRTYCLGMDALLIEVSRTRIGTELWFGHGCTGYRMLLEHERNYGLRMEALVTVCSWNTNGIMVCAWMHWLRYALGTRTE